MFGKLAFKNSFKSSDTEETVDKYFYRPFGYVMAIASQKMNLTPNQITVFSIFVGVTAGHMFFYESVVLNIIGVLLMVWAQALDSADGQLARITNTRSHYGRILDGFCGNLWFLSIYVHILLRMIIFYDYSYWMALVVLAAGLSHSLQSGYADYFRNQYLYFVYGKNKSEIDSSQNIRKQYNKLSWLKTPFKKYLQRIYLNYTIEQEWFSKNTIKLYEYAEKHPEKADAKLANAYRKLFKPNIKLFNILTTNIRLTVLFITVLSGHFLLYFLFDLTVLNLLWVYTVYKQEKLSKQLLVSLGGA